MEGITDKSSPYQITQCTCYYIRNHRCNYVININKGETTNRGNRNEVVPPAKWLKH